MEKQFLTKISPSDQSDPGVTRGNVGSLGGSAKKVVSKWGVFEKSEVDRTNWRKRKFAKGKLPIKGGKLRDKPAARIKGPSHDRCQTSIPKFFKSIGPQDNLT